MSKDTDIKSHMAAASLSPPPFYGRISQNETIRLPSYSKATVHCEGDGKILPSDPPTETGFSPRPSRSEETAYDGRGSSNADNLKPIVLAVIGRVFSRVFDLGERMGELVQFIPKRDLERARLIQEARAIYERIFPTEKSAGGEQRSAGE
jgi:hypothetical protein